MRRGKAGCACPPISPPIWAWRAGQPGFAGSSGPPSRGYRLSVSLDSLLLPFGEQVEEMLVELFVGPAAVLVLVEATDNLVQQAPPRLGVGAQAMEGNQPLPEGIAGHVAGE